MSRKLAGVMALVLCLAIPPGTEAGRRRSDNDTKAFEWSTVTEKDWDQQANVVTKAGAVMLFEKIEADDTGLRDGKIYRTIYRRIRILSDEGKSLADVDAPYFSSKQKIVDLKGRTVLPSGEAVELTEDNIFEKDAVRMKGERIRQTSFSLPGVTNNCIIEYMIRYRLPHTVQTWIVQKEIPLVEGELAWSFYPFKKQEISLIWYQFLANPEFEPLEPRHVWENAEFEISRIRKPLEAPTEFIYKARNVPPLADEPYGIPDEAAAAKLHCFYSPRLLPIVFWSNLTRLIGRIRDEISEESGKVKDLAKEFETLQTDQEKIDAAYAWLQDNVLNLSYLTEDQVKEKLNKRDLKEINGIDDVLKNGYGDNYTINETFDALLHVMGIESVLAFCVDRTDGQFNKEVLSWQFDRTLVLVPDTNGGYTPYAPGEMYLEPGMLPWFAEGTQALIEGPEGKLVPLPFAPSSSSRTESAFTFDIGTDLAVKGSMEQVCTGHPARSERVSFAEETDADIQSELAKEFEEEFAGAEVSVVSIDGNSGVADPFHVTCTMAYPALAAQGNLLLLKPASFMGEASNPFKSETRTGDIRFRYAYATRDSALFQIPDGWSVQGLPTDTVVETKAGKCSVHYVGNGQTICVIRDFELKSPYWENQAYRQVRTLFEAREKAAEGTVVLSKTL